MIRNGHSRVFEYGHTFFTESIDELMEAKREETLNMAVAVRMSNASNEEWKKMVDEFAHTQKKRKPEAKKAKRQMTADEHRAVIARLRGL